MRTAPWFVIWRQNVSYFRLLNERSVERALTALFIELRQADLMEQLPELALEEAKKPGKVRLDGFNLLSAYGNVKPYTWLITKPKLSIPEAIRIYESAATQPLSGLDSVGSRVSHIHHRNSDERRMLERFSLPSQWKQPMLLLAASYLYLGAELESYTDETVCMRLGPALIEVTSKGCYSNQHRSVIQHAESVSNLGSAIYFPSITVDHPALRALAALSIDTSTLPALTIAAHALEEGIVSKSFFNKLAKLEGPIIDKARHQKRDLQKASAALNNCLEIMNHGVYDIIPELFEAAVPDLMSYRKLQSIVGAPTQVKEGRQIRQETLVSWRIRFEKVLEELQDAKS